jgi:hypothetical protein
MVRIAITHPMASPKRPPVLFRLSAHHFSKSPYADPLNLVARGETSVHADIQLCLP